MSFKMRTSKPKAGNKYYIRLVTGGYNGAVQGSPTDKNCNVLANCVGYANGRFNEIGNYKKCKYQLTCNAEDFIERAKALGLKISKKPVLGGIIVWQKGKTGNGNDGYGHVAIVEKIYNSNKIYTSESFYGGAAFANVTRTNSNGKWGAGTAYRFRGCIINPAVTTEKPKKETTKNKSKYVLGLYKVNVKGCLNVRKTPEIKSNNIIKVYTKGTKFDTYEIKNEKWARTPSGWVDLDYCKLIKKY